MSAHDKKRDREEKKKTNAEEAQKTNNSCN